MEKYSSLLDKAIAAIAETKAEGDVESLFHSTETTALQGDGSHIDAFELVAFFVVKEREKPPTEAQRHGGGGRGL